MKSGSGPRSMKGVRLCYGLMMAAFLFAGALTGQRLCFLLFTFQLLLLLFCMGLLLFTFLSFAFLQSLSQSVAEKGETVGLHIEIHNEMPYPFTRMKLHIRGMSRLDDRSLSFCLAPMDAVRFDLQLPCRWRGETSVGMHAVELEDMFGLLHLRLPLDLLPYYRMKPLLVLPHADALTLSAAGRAGRRQQSGTLFHRSTAGQDPYGLRDWQPGDSDRQIHWKASAAHHALYARQYEREARPQSLLLIDDAPLQPGEEGAVMADLLCCAAATLIRWALANGSGVRLCAGSPGIPAAEGELLRDFPDLQRWLALLPFAGKGQTAARLHSELMAGHPRGYTIYLLCADAAPLCSAMAEALRQGAQLVCIRTAPGEDEPLPELPDGIPDILLTPGCDIGSRLGEGL